MKVRTHSAGLVEIGSGSIADIVRAVPKLEDRSIVAVSSKALAVALGDVVELEKDTLEDLVRQHSEQYLADSSMLLSIVDGQFVENAGLDSLGKHQLYARLPNQPFRVACEIHQALKSSHGEKLFGVIITDSRSTMGRRGAIGYCVSHYGFDAVNAYSGTGLYGGEYQLAASSIDQSLAAAANVAMGEGDEQTPVATISEVGFVQFHEEPLDPEEYRTSVMVSDQDVYAPLLNTPIWSKSQ